MLFESHEPTFLKDDSSLQKQIEALERALEESTPDEGASTEKQLKLYRAGLRGENQIAFELANSHLPIFVLRDLCLEKGGLKAQIDFLVITPYVTLLIECKNLVGDIEITERGDFIRTFGEGRFRQRKGIYSPITQNERHAELVRAIRTESMGVVQRAFFNKFFSDNYKTVVVLANAETVLDDEKAPQKIKEQIIRCDGLIRYIKGLNATSKSNGKSSWSEMEQRAQWWLEQHRDIPIEDGGSKQEAAGVPDYSPTDPPLCPKCGVQMVLRTVKRGDRAGKHLWGCPNFPQCRSVIDAD